MSGSLASGSLVSGSLASGSLVSGSLGSGSLASGSTGTKTLVTGGVRAGKSRWAEERLAAEPAVAYLAPGYPPTDADPEWAARVAAHRARRPAHWRTIETADLAGALGALDSPGLIDCLGTWLTRQLDELDAWSGAPGWEDAIGVRLDALVEAWRTCPHRLVAVSNEVGWGVVSEHRSGRIFADWLGRTNQAIAAASDEVWLVVSGRALRLPDA